MQSSGGTVTFREVGNFHQLSLEEATRIIYDELVPACESKGVLLSGYGNHKGWGTLCNVEDYNRHKANHTLFNIKRVQKAFASLPAIVQRDSQYHTGSYGLKHDVENHPSQSGYITNGDLIAAMLLRGHDARFGKENEPMDVNCAFQVKVTN